MEELDGVVVKILYLTLQNTDLLHVEKLEVHGVIIHLEIIEEVQENHQEDQLEDHQIKEEYLMLNTLE